MPALPVVLFALAAVLGVTMAVRHFGKKETPLGVGLLHGAFAASGLVLLILAVLRAPSAGLGGVALGLLVAAALGGFILLARHLQKKPWPNALVLLHGGAAVTGFIVLLVWVYGS